MMNITISGKKPVGSYPNNEAFSEAVKLATRHEKFNCILDLVEGCEAVKIETKTKSRFILQLNEDTLNWLLKYLMEGETDSFGIDASEVTPSDEPDGNSYRKHMLQYICEQKVARSVQFTPEVRERTTGKVSATANFLFGTIFFYVDRDEEMRAWLEDRENRGE